MEKLKKVLIDLNLGHLYPNFEKETVSIEDIPELLEKDLKDLGVKTIGDRTRLIKACRSSLFGQRSLMDREDQTYCKTVVPVEESCSKQPTQDSYRGSPTMVVPERPVRDNGSDVRMGRGARVIIGDRGNDSITGDSVEADEIGTVNSENRETPVQPPSNSQYSELQNCRFNLGEGAVFDLGNRDNQVKRGTQIKAKNIGTYNSKNH